MSGDSTLAKVSALLRKTEENGATEAEAQAAVVKAQEMMLAHSITFAQVAKYDSEGNQVKLEADYIRVYEDTGMRGKAPTTQCYLAHYVARAMGGKVIRTSRKVTKDVLKRLPVEDAQEQGGYLTFFGVGIVDSIVEVYNFLRLVSDVESAKAMRDRPPVTRWDFLAQEYVEVREPGRTWRLGWLVGFNARIDERLQEQYREVEEAGNGTALALIGDLVEDKIYQVFGRTYTQNVHYRTYNGNAAAHGRAFADKVDIGAAKLGSSTTPRLTA